MGQTDPTVRFIARGGGATVLISDTSMTFALSNPGPTTPDRHATADSRQPNHDAATPKYGAAAVVQLGLAGATGPVVAKALMPLAGRVNYFIGNDPTKWHTKVPTYGRVELHGVYPGIDLAFYGGREGLEYDWIVAPGADASRIRLSITGAQTTAVDAAGDLVLTTAAGPFTHRAPRAYQDLPSGRRVVSAAFERATDGSISLRLGAFARDRQLLIDPAFVYSTYLGGSSGGDDGDAIAVDSAGNAYIGGATASNNFPTLNPIQPANRGHSDAFVTKINASGTALVYSTYLGGSSNEYGGGIAVDSAGNAYVTGQTQSADFPTMNAIQPASGAGVDAFVTKINPSGTALIYSTYLGGNSDDEGNAIALDSAGNAYVAGQTRSINFPTANAIQPAHGGGLWDAFVTKINSAGMALVYSTYLGGSGDDFARGIAVDGSGSAYVTGNTRSLNFPVVNGLMPARGGFDAFVTKINPAGTALVYSTYLDGPGDDYGQGIAVDGGGSAYIVGTTSSTDFLTTQNAFQPTKASGFDALLTKLDPTGTSMVYSTFLGGNKNDLGLGIAVDRTGNAYVTGETASTDFPTVDPLQAANAGGVYDAFVTTINSTGTALLFSTYLGGAADDTARGIALDGAGNIYVTGSTASANFPTKYALQPSNAGAGGYNAFVAKIGPQGGPSQRELLGGSNPSEKQCSCKSTRYPVDDATGDFFHTFTDISIPGRGLALNFQRTYNSLSASQNGPFGYGWTYSYASRLTVDGSGNATIAQENGSTVSFANSGGVYTPPSRVLASLVKNVDGTYTFKRADQTKYQFSASGQLTAESDRNGYTTALSYTSGLLTGITDPGGRTLTLAYTGTLVTGLASSTGRSVAYQYDGSGNLQQVTDVNGGLTKFTLYPDRTMHTMTDANGGVVNNVYDGVGRVTSQTDPMQRPPTTFDYSTPGQTKITDPKGNVTTEVYDNNVLVSRTLGYGSPQAATWQYTYDPATLGLASIVDPNGRTVSNTWDGSGNLLTHTDGLGRRTTYTYDSLNDVLTVRDPLGVPTTNTFDAAGNLKSTSRTVTSTPTTQSAVSTSSYTLADSDGVTWKEIDSAKLRVTVSPSANQATLLSANVDLWTSSTGGYNQDLGIFVSDNNGADTLLAWKESGGFAGTFSPNAVYAQHLYNMTGGHSYVFKLKWKTNKNAAGATIWAGAGPIGTAFSPTSLTAETFPFGLTPTFAVTSSPYSLADSDGATWQPIDDANLTATLSPPSSGTAVLGANADLFTGSAGYNQDLGIFVSDNNSTDTLVAWKESGGFAGTYSPNAAFVKATYAMTAGHSYTFKLKWKTNKNAPGVTIYAGAGSGSGLPGRSPTSLFAQYIPTGANPYSAVKANFSSFTGSDGATWQTMDAALNVAVPGSDNTYAHLGANVDLFTDTASYNQDIGLFVSDNGGVDTLLAWKESGGFGGTYSPNAAYVQITVPMASGHNYVFRLKWKTNKTAPGVTIYAGAGSGSSLPGRSPTTLVAEVTSRPPAATSPTATMTYQYTGGDVTAMIDQDTKTWQYGYDQYGDTNLVIDPLGDKTTYTFNADGWVKTKVSPNGYAIGPTSSYTTTYDYSDQRLGGGRINGFGDIGSTTDPLARKTTFTYDANRSLTDNTDFNTHTTHQIYNFDNELTEVDRADGSKVNTQYDLDGNVQQQIDGLNNPTTYGYDSLNHLSSVQDPLLRTTNYVYDAVGNIKTITDPQNQTTTNSYDAADELTAITYSDGVTPNVGPIHYDADGQRTDITDGTGKTTFTFDALHRLTQQTNGAGSQVFYGYDLRGHVTSITYPGGANQVIRTYDDAGRFKTVKDWLANTTTYNYDANSNLSSQAYPNGTAATFTRDAADQISSIVDKQGANTFLNLSYTQDGVGNLKSENSIGYTYDPNNRLLTSAGSSYGYDNADNLTRLINGTTQTYDAANQLLSAQAPAVTSFSYDARGNRTGISPTGQATTSLKYDQSNRLTSYGAVATYTYNGDGLRMRKTVSGTSEAFTYDAAEGLPLIIQDGATSYVTGMGGLQLEQISGNSVTYFHQDQLGSTRALTNQAGTVAGTGNYDAYGNGPALASPFGYAGQYRDSESGFLYLRARYYDPGAGQFISRDPITATTRAPYSYVGDNPLNAPDPTGLKATKLDPTDPNYCWKLRELIRKTNQELSHRYYENQRYLDMEQWLPLPFQGWAEADYFGHRKQFYDKQTYLQTLVDEWNQGPCGPLPAGTADWLGRLDPLDERYANSSVAAGAAAAVTVGVAGAIFGWLGQVEGELAPAL